MKILIDFLTKLDPEYEAYRLSLFQELVKIKEFEVSLALRNKKSIKANGLYKMVVFKKNFHWEKDNEEIKKIKPDGIILFDQPDRRVLQRYSCFVFIEALAGGKLLSLEETKIKQVLNKLKYARGLILRTKYSQVYLANHYNIEKGNLFSIGQGIEDTFFKSNITDDTKTVRQVLSIYRISRPYIYVSGKLSENPNIDKSLEVFASIHQKHPDLKLLIASMDFDMGWDNKPRPLNKMAEEMLDLCEKYRITRKVIFTGQIERSHLPIILDNAVLVMHLEERKDFSRSLLESLSAGVPLIVNDSPVLKEITGNAALIATPKVTSNVIEAVQLILGNENERVKLQRKAILRSEYYKWEAVASRLTEFLLLKNKNKPKENLLLLTRDDKFPDTFKLFANLFKFTSVNIYAHTKSIGGFIKLIKLFRQNEYVVINDRLDVGQIIYVSFLKLLSRNSYFIAFLDNESEFKPIGNFFRRKIKFIRSLMIGFYLNRIYKKVLVTNPFCVGKVKKAFRQKEEKVQYLPLLFEKKLDKSKSVKLRTSARLKNYLCITARVDNLQTWNKLYDMVNSLYADFQEFKVLVIKDPFLDLKNSGGKKIKKRFLFFSESELDEVLLNSKIYFDFREKISQFDILTALKARNCCIVKANLSTQFLIKPGINGYIYSSLETDKIHKQIDILFKNKVHLNDIRRVNALRTDVFEKENIEISLKILTEKWS